MKLIYKFIQESADSKANILISGESGTGKELVALALHENSKRNKEKFLAINCSAIPKDLIESELFGYVKGAFTNATSRKVGKFEYADKGTIFLDEIADLPYDLQAKLLRVMQEKQIYPIGSNESIPIDVKIITATNKNLYSLIKQSKFREDLYYRLNVIHLYIPPLRERKDDIPLLIAHFISKYNSIYKKCVKDISEGFYEYLINKTWTGNVRELENFIQRCILFSNKESLALQDITLNSSISDFTYQYNESMSLKENLSLFETRLLEELLRKNDNNIKKISELLEIDKKTVYRKIKKYDIDI